MPEPSALSNVVKKGRSSYTLIELLTVMAIIAILAALVLSAASGMIKRALRNRAATEIQAMSAGLEGYKTDNGIYPPTSGITGQLLTNSAADPYFANENDGSQSGGVYQQSSQILYMALSGQTNFLDTPGVGVKSYAQFKINQLGNTTTAAGTAPGASTSTYLKDPWGYSYGYSTGSAASYPYNGTGLFDLWSTGGTLYSKPNTNAWISNWTQ